MTDVKRAVYRVTNDRGRRSFRTLAEVVSAAARDQVGKPYRIEVDPGSHAGEVDLVGDIELVARDGKGTAQICGWARPAISTEGSVRVVDLDLIGSQASTIVATRGTLHMARCRLWGHGGVCVDGQNSVEVELNACVVSGGRISFTRASGTLVNTIFHKALNNSVSAEQSRLEIGGCEFRGGVQHAIRVTEGSKATIVDSKFNDFPLAVISVDGQSGATVSGCRMTGGQAPAISVSDKSQAVVSDLVVVDSFQGVSVASGSRAVIDDSIITDTGDAGVMATGNSTVMVRRCTFRNNTASAIYVNEGALLEANASRVGGGDRALLVDGARVRVNDLGAEDLEVTALDIRNSAKVDIKTLNVQAGGRGLLVTGEAAVVTVVGATVTGTLRSAVRIQDGARLAATSLEISKAVGNGLEAAGSSTVRLEDALVERSGVHGVAIGDNAALAASHLSITDSHQAGLVAIDNAVVDISGIELHRNSAAAMILADTATGNIGGWTATGDGSSTDLRNDSLVVVEGAAVATTGGGSDGFGGLTSPEVPRAERSVAGTSTEEESRESRLDELLTELDELVGLEPVKKQIKTQINVVRLARRRQEAGLAEVPMSRHLLFTGPPGTGKTSIARLYGRILAALGALPRGHLHEVGRADLVGKYVGHTAVQTREHFAKARGGILFIDEAYTLARKAGTGHDFGQEAIDELVKQMEEHRADTAVIAAGYTEEMRDFVAVNPGLASRFSRTIEFPLYSPAELVEIFDLFAWQSDYDLGEGLDDVLEEHFGSPTLGANLGNARYARNLFERILEHQANRLSVAAEPSVDEMRLLTTEDFGAANDSL